MCDLAGAGVVMLIHRVIKVFALPRDKGTHPLIESLNERLKMATYADRNSKLFANW